MRNKKIVAVLMTAVLVLGALALAGCSKKGGSITGEWKMDNSDTTYVITDTAITAPTGEIPYKLGDDGEITLFAGTAQESKAKYELSDDGKTLTIIETFNTGASEDSSGTPQEIKTVFTKVSDNKDAKPSTGASNTGSDAKSDANANKDADTTKK